jgi:hypothetical protein
MPLTRDTFIANAQLTEQLADLSDVEMLPGDGESDRVVFSVEGADDLKVFARDGGGGQFAASSSSGPVFYVTSEGAAGAVAKDFASFIGMTVAMPYWRDVLKFSGNGRIGEMRRAALALEDDLADYDDALACRDILADQIKLDADLDFVFDLHAAVASGPSIRSHDGSAAESLFGRYTVDDNPMMRAATG